MIAALSVLSALESKYSKFVDRQLRAGPFSDTVNLYAQPGPWRPGDPMRMEDAVQLLRRGGYSPDPGSANGWFESGRERLIVWPADGRKNRTPTVITFREGAIESIADLSGNSIPEFDLGPVLVTNVLPAARESRQLVRFQELPPHVVHAVLSAEDKRFFSHSGIDPVRIAKAVYVNLRSADKRQGASTLTMQLARSFWLTREKIWSRKIAELFITLQLERKLTKEQIFQLYANEVYLGRKGTYAIRGLGVAARAYFDKHVTQLTLAEAATLAGILQRPSYYDPARNKERVINRRNLILSLMRENGYISDARYREAAAEPLDLSAPAAPPLAAPYFLDLALQELEGLEADRINPGAIHQVRTTLHLGLQQAAEQAIEEELPELDKKLKKIHGASAPPVQVALAAIDPRTGAVLALVGGRDYTRSQLNRAVAMRQPGSAFKPFVYAAALNTGLTGGPTLFTLASVVEDLPTNFRFGGEDYIPGNFHGAFHGEIRLRQAFTKSLNIPTVRIASSVGLRRIVELAHDSGIRSPLRATPALALGAYEVTPLELAGAYGTFANGGEWVEPGMVEEIRDDRGTVLYSRRPERKKALPPQLNFLMVSLMRGVVLRGTGAGVNRYSIPVPVAGKTGSSRDGWFAGFTTELVAAVWVGYDDNRDLQLEGAKSSLPIWANFMKRAVGILGKPEPFREPAGLINVEIDRETGLQAGPTCIDTGTEIFFHGTAPRYCDRDHSLLATTGEMHPDEPLPEQEPVRFRVKR